MILILSGVLLCLLAVIFLIVGTKLARERDSEETKTTETVDSSEETVRVALPEVMKGRQTLLETADSTTLVGRLRALKQAGLEMLGIYEDYNFTPATRNSDRWYIAARCRKG
jgi:uncharacterized membrane protein